VSRYRDLADYIRQRAHDHEHNTTTLSEALGYGRSYINSIVNKQFGPSSKRCYEIAAFFGDDPNIILELVGFYEPPREDDLTKQLMGTAGQLPNAILRVMIGLTEYIKTRVPPNENGATDNLACVLLPSGEMLLLEVPNKPAESIKLIIESAFKT
jgi:transcriptional regulator with XRE-family HTH domain